MYCCPFFNSQYDSNKLVLEFFLTKTNKKKSPVWINLTSPIFSSIKAVSYILIFQKIEYVLAESNLDYLPWGKYLHCVLTFL